jgi:hypothetical protein
LKAKKIFLIITIIILAASLTGCGKFTYNYYSCRDGAIVEELIIETPKPKDENGAEELRIKILFTVTGYLDYANLLGYSSFYFNDMKNSDTIVVVAMLRFKDADEYRKAYGAPDGGETPPYKEGGGLFEKIYLMHERQNFFKPYEGVIEQLKRDYSKYYTSAPEYYFGVGVGYEVIRSDADSVSLKSGLVYEKRENDGLIGDVIINHEIYLHQWKIENLNETINMYQVVPKAYLWYIIAIGISLIILIGGAVYYKIKHKSTKPRPIK